MLDASEACDEFSVMQPFIYDSSSGCLMKWKLLCGPLMDASYDNNMLNYFPLLSVVELMFSVLSVLDGWMLPSALSPALQCYVVANKQYCTREYYKNPPYPS